MTWINLFRYIEYSIRTIDRTPSGATAPGQSGPGSNGKEGVLHIPQSSSITGASPSDCLVSCIGHWSGEEYYLSAGVQSLYSTAPADWASLEFVFVCTQ